MAMDRLKIVLKPAPDPVPISPETPPDVRQYFENVQKWCRDAEKAIRALVDRVNAITP